MTITRRKIRATRVRKSAVREYLDAHAGQPLASMPGLVSFLLARETAEKRSDELGELRYERWLEAQARRRARDGRDK